MGELWLNGISYSGGGGADVEITGEASGAIASFADGSANPLKSLVVDINPVQAGSGTPAPDNVRPISGWSSVGVTVEGKNLLDYDTYFSAFKVSENNFEAGNSSFATISMNVGAYVGKTITLSIYISEVAGFNRVYLQGTINGQTVSGTNDARPTTAPKYITITVTPETTNDVIKLTYGNISGTISLKWSNMQLEIGASRTDFTPYVAGTTETISLGQEVYGGELDVTDEVIHPYKYYASYNGETLVGRWISSLDEYEEGATPTTGAQVVDFGAFDSDIIITPTTISSRNGVNNIWADSGDVDVVYIRDIDKAFNILWNAVMNSNSGTRSLNLMKGAISETKEDIEEPIKEEEETKEGNDENQR